MIHKYQDFVFEGKGRIKIDGNQVVLSALPKESDPGETQEIGFNAKSMIPDTSIGVPYITDIDEIDDKQIKSFISKFKDFSL